MKITKILTIALCASLFIATSSLAKKPEHANKKHKVKKQKRIPYGIQKKMNRGGQFPKGWYDKVSRGEIVDQYILDKGKIVNNNKYPIIEGTKVYKILDKTIRVLSMTKRILEVIEDD